MQIQKLRAVMSDKEYHVITACAASNIAEPKRAIPTFRGTGQHSGEAAADVAAVVDASGTAPGGEAGEGGDVELGQRTPWSTNRVVVRVEQAELELFIGLERDASLASLMVSAQSSGALPSWWIGLCWVLLRIMSSLSRCAARMHCVCHQHQHPLLVRSSFHAD